ncbi:MAG: type II toxin-antitoxin system death-on-curing family toxin [Mycobacteriaceae bacterium]|nr:type II toxin-antitoxin system death-on-curing family toxin [Mycobacteriaceae bacterium]
MVIRFLTQEEVVAEQERQLAVYGGGSPGILNGSTLGSAVAQPQASFSGQYLYEDLFAMATAYLVSLVKGHAFGNGNKRIGLASALVFLYLNGQLIELSNDEAVELVLTIISGERRRESASELLRTRAKPVAGVPDLEAATAWVHETYAAAFAVLAQ